jgi:hypothetical protein
MMLIYECENGIATYIHEGRIEEIEIPIHKRESPPESYPESKLADKVNIDAEETILWA